MRISSFYVDLISDATSETLRVDIKEIAVT
jgi:hypothetical protein